VEIFVITLKNSKERHESIKSQFYALNLSFNFFWGINGQELTKGEIDKYYDDKMAKKCFGRSLVLGEIGCALSHHFIYKKILDDNIDRAIILEDDSILKKDFVLVMNMLDGININKYVVKLDLQDNMHGFILPIHRIKLNENYEIQHSTTVGYARGYYIDNKAAKILFDLTKKIFVVADSWGTFRNSIRLRILNNSIVGLDEKFYSTIWGDTEWRPCFESDDEYISGPPSHLRTKEILRNILTRVKPKIDILRMLFH
jgi:glycosyl transferase family 25